MNLKIKYIKTLVVALTMCATSWGQGELPAFPGAEGHGMYATGGRSGKVMYVTHLNDDNTQGSLRTAVEQKGARIIVFSVSGTIHLKSELKIKESNITIAGQTAPGDGICIADYPVTIGADNVIIRFVRFRMGDEAEQEGDAIGGRFNKNILLDHCSMSWSTDECVSVYMNEYTTVQWCIISESLRNSVHGKGSHGYGGIWGGKYASFHHNLLAHHDSRNPRLGETKGDAFALTDAVDLRNNVIYNWQGNSTYGGEAMNVNIVNCYYKPGPATTKTERIIAIDKLLDEGYAITGIWGQFYIDGNVLEASTRATEDNWTYGVYNQIHSKYGTISDEAKDSMKVDMPHPTGMVTTHTAEKAYEKVLAYVGASLTRDTIDKRILYDVSTGTATYMDGGNGSINGIIDTQGTVGGWPALATSNVPTDSDSDGMPDDWENSNGLDAADATDAKLTTVDGEYTNVEAYLNSLVESITTNQNVDGEVVNVAIPTDTTQTSLTKVVEEINALDYFYNNTNKQLTVKDANIINEIQLISITGSVIISEKPKQEEVTINLTGIKPGVYLIRMYNNQRKVYTGKLINY